MKKLISKNEFKKALKDYQENGGFQSLIQVALQNIIDTEGETNSIGRIINFSISKENALNLVSTSAGILIDMNEGFRVIEYDNETLGIGLFVISKDAIEILPEYVHSILVFKCGIDKIIIEFSKDFIHTDNPGGDGLKIKLPTA
jgi:hypothetical protein